MTVIWPDVKQRLVAELRALLEPDVTVFDGPVVTGDDPLAYLCVGDQPSSDDDGAGEFEQDRGPDGFTVTESGVVLCEIGAVNGDTTMPSAWAVFDAVATYVQQNQTLNGLLEVNATLRAAATVLQAQTYEGAAQRLLVSITYSTLL